MGRFGGGEGVAVTAQILAPGESEGMPTLVAFAAHNVRTQRDPIADAQGVAVEIETRTLPVVDFGDDANDFVPRNYWKRRIGFGIGTGVLLRLAALGVFVRTADAAHLDLEEYRAIFQFRKGKLLNLNLSRMNHHCRVYAVAHKCFL